MMWSADVICVKDTYYILNMRHIKYASLIMWSADVICVFKYVLCVLKCVSSYSDATLYVSTYLRSKKRVATEGIHSHTQEPLVHRQQPLQ